MMSFYSKEGWKVNPNDKVVQGILKALERNNGLCPCQNDSEDLRCPCSNFRLKNKCCCGLYVPVEAPIVTE